ncbi:MAG: dienelactone hydrolase family protein [bacterium]|nr:dienelactone hydrolase family protein [bacterium]
MFKTKLLILILAVIATGVVAAKSFNATRGRQGIATNVEMLASDSPRPITERDVAYFADRMGFYTAPQEEGNYPGVVMIHEWWGLNDNIRQMARELAKEGYAVLAVDLFGTVAATAEEARVQTTSLDQAAALENLRAAIRYLKSQGAQKIASLGWCFGGGQSMQLALAGEDLSGTVIYYGNVVTEQERLASIDWPVLGIFGEADQSIPADRVRQFDAALDEAGVVNAVHIYPGVGHAFANPSGANYAPDETQDAWDKTLRFLSENLKDGAMNASKAAVADDSIKEFTMTSFYEVVDGKPKPQFSLKEIRVKRGDAVRIHVTNTRGMHDFTLDEYAIYEETPLDKEVVITFTADKAGEFIYYCSMPNHRDLGQWGTLVVEE